MNITDLLARSRAAHQQFRRLSADSQNQNLLAMGEAIQAALLARLEAHADDPEYADPAWVEDTQIMKGQTSDALVRFYGRYLSPREAGGA